MKKAALGALALATVIGLSVVSPLTTAAAAEVYFSLNSSPAEIQAIKEREEKISDLIVKKAAALRKSGTVPKELEQALRQNGVETMSAEDAYNLSVSDPTMSTTLNTSQDGHFSDHSVITEANNCIFETYSEEYRMNGRLYTYKLIFAMPSNDQSALRIRGRAQMSSTSHFLAGSTAFLSTLINNAIDSALSNISAKFELALTLADAFNTAWHSASSVVISDGFDFEYEWNISEISCFTYLFLPGDDWTQATGYRLIQKSNLVDMEIEQEHLTAVYPEPGTGTLPGSVVEYTNSTKATYTSTYFANGYMSSKYYIERDKRYEPETRLYSFDIRGLNNTKIKTIQLPNPYNPGFIGYEGN